jgi:hypothetical protein
MKTQQRPRGLAGRRQRRQRIATRVEKQARRRLEQQRFTEPLTGKRAGQVARAQARTEFGPVEQQIKSEIRGSVKREGDLGEWYGKLADDFAAGGQLAGQAFTTAEQATNARLDAASKSAQDTLKGLAAEDDAFASLVGGPKNSGGLAQAAEAAAAAERQRATLQAPITAMRASHVASYVPRTNAARMGGIEARQGERERRRKQQQDLQALGRERGQTTVKNLQTLREQEQDRSTQREALGAKKGYNRALETQSKLGLKGTRLTAAATIASANAAARARERGASAQEIVAAEQKAAARITGKAQENTAKIQGKNAGKDAGGYNVKEAKSLLRSMFGKKTVSAQKAIDSLVNRGVSYGVAVQAVRQLAGGR